MSELTENHERIVFDKDPNGDFSARVDDIIVTIEIEEENVSDAGSVMFIDKMIIPPCHEEYVQEPSCPDCKPIDDIDILEVCEKTCPHLFEHDDIGEYIGLCGYIGSPADTARAIRTHLSEDYHSEREDRVAIKAFIHRDWVIDGVVILEGIPQH